MTNLCLICLSVKELKKSGKFLNKEYQEICVDCHDEFTLQHGTKKIELALERVKSKWRQHFESCLKEELLEIEGKS